MLSACLYNRNCWLVITLVYADKRCYASCLVPLIAKPGERTFPSTAAAIAPLLESDIVLGSDRSAHDCLPDTRPRSRAPRKKVLVVVL